jgi:hypothetical protein
MLLLSFLASISEQQNFSPSIIEKEILLRRIERDLPEQ